jgi:hypothetical protein
MVDGSTPVSAQDTRRVRIVDHHDGAVPLRKLYKLRQGANVAVHRKNAVSDQ